MNLPGLVSRFLTGTYSVTRETSPTTATRGYKDEGVISTLTVRGSASPASGADLQKLPEGRRTAEVRRLYTATRLYVGDPDDGFLADRVTISGVVYELEHLERWDDPRSGGAIYMALAVRV